MMKTIGIIAEGPRDHELLSAVIDNITGQENSYQFIQPEPNAAGEFGNGWKGVWKWCENNQGRLRAYMQGISPTIDLLVIHMDGDVFRCEKEIHCNCQKQNCNMSAEVHPLVCQQIKDGKCPVLLPCSQHEPVVEAGAEFLRSFLQELVRPDKSLAISYVISCDATDAWILAAFEDYTDYESILDPWGKEIAKKAKYHGIKIKNRPHKEKRTYAALIEEVCLHWDSVVAKCLQAKRFDEDVRKFLA